MKNKKGFTLVELLAVIVVLSLVIVIAGLSVTQVRKNANKELAKSLEETITKLGPTIYSYESYLDNSNFMDAYNKGDKFYISLKELKTKGYLKSENLNIGNVTCGGYLEVNPQRDEKAIFKGYINCEGLRTTYDYIEPKEYTCLSD